MNGLKTKLQSVVGVAAWMAIIVTALTPTPAHAATWWWNTTTTGLWSTGANWDNAASGGTTGAGPANDTTTDVVVFNRTATNGIEVVTLGSDASIAGITFSNRGPTTLQSSTSTSRTLTIGSSGITLGSAAGPVAIGVSGSAVNVSLATGQTWTNNASSPILFSISGANATSNPFPALTVAGTVSTSVAGSHTLTVGGAGATTISGNMTNGTGTLGLTKSGAGALTLSGTNNYSGVTNVSAGTLNFAKQVSLYNNTTANWTDTNLVVESGATAAFRLGGSGEFTSANVDILKGLGTATGGFKAGSALGLDTTSGAQTYSSAIADTNSGANSIGFTKLGSNTLTLSAASTYTGTTNVFGGMFISGGSLVATGLTLTGSLVNTAAVVISGGTLTIGDTATAANNSGRSNRINAAAPLSLANFGGANATLSLAAAAAGSTHSQTFGSLAVGRGAHTLTSNAGTGTNTLTFTGSGGAGYTRSTAGVVNIAPQTGFSVVFTNDPTSAGGSAVAGTSADKILVGATINGSDFVGLTGAGPYTTGTATYTSTGTTTWTAGKNMNVTGNVSPGSATNVNSIRFSGLHTVTLTGANVVDSGMILVSSAAGGGTVRVQGGELTSGNGRDLIVIDRRQSDLRGNNNPVDVSSTITDNGATPISLTLGGNTAAFGMSGFNSTNTSNVVGNVQLSGTNSYTGGTTLIGTRVSLADDRNFGAVPATPTVNIRVVDNAVIGPAATGPGASITLHANRGIDLGGGALLQFAAGSGNTITVNGVISGSGQVQTPNNSPGLLVLNGANTFAGTLLISNHNVRANDGVGLPAAANLRFWANYQNGTTVTGAVGTLETSGVFSRSEGSGPGQVTWSNSGGAGSPYGAGGFTAVGGPLTVALGGTASPATFAFSAGAPLTLQSTTADSPLTWMNPLNLGSSIRRIVVGSTTQSATMSGVIGGTTTSGLRITDGGLISLSGSNTYQGKTYIENGIVTVTSLNSVTGGASASSLGVPSSVANGTIDFGPTSNQASFVTAALKYAGTGETTDRGIALVSTLGGGNLGATLDHSGTGLLKFTSNLTITANGARTLTLQGSTSGTGELAGVVPDGITSSTLNTAASSGATQIVLSSTTSVGAGDSVAGSGFQAGTVVTSVTYDIANSKVFVNLSKTTTSALSIGAPATFSNVTNLSKAGSGVWALSGANTYSGTTTVTAGTLRIGGAGVLGSGSHARPISIDSGATFDYASSAAQELSGTISGNGIVRLSGGGTLTLSGSNSYAGGTEVTAGTLRAGASGASFGGGSITLSGGSLDLNGRSDIANAVTLSGGSLVGGTLDVSQLTATSGTVTAGLTGFGGLTKAAAGRLVLAGSNSYVGTTTVNAGQLVVNGSLDGGVSVGAAGTLLGSGTVGGSTTIAGLHSPGNSPAIQTFEDNLEYLAGASVLWELTGNTTANAANPAAVYDQIVVGGNLTFSGSTTLSLSFGAAGSVVDWTDAFWGSNRSWTLFDLGVGTTSGFATFLTLDGSPSTWFDAQGTPQSLASARPQASFGLEMVGQDVVLNYVAVAVPEPATIVLAGIGMAAVSWSLRRRRCRCRFAAGGSIPPRRN